MDDRAEPRRADCSCPSKADSLAPRRHREDGSEELIEGRAGPEGQTHLFEFRLNTPGLSQTPKVKLFYSKLTNSQNRACVSDVISLHHRRVEEVNARVNTEPGKVGEAQARVKKAKGKTSGFQRSKGLSRKRKQFICARLKEVM